MVEVVRAEDVSLMLQHGGTPKNAAYGHIYQWYMRMGSQGPREPSILERIATAATEVVVDGILGDVERFGLGDKRSRRRWQRAAQARLLELRKGAQ